MSGATIASSADEYVRLLSRAGIPGDADGAELAGLSDRTLLDALRRLSETRRIVDAEQARVVAEIARRSEIGDESSLARRNGERNAVALVARESGSSTHTARVLVDVAGATAPRQSLLGEPLPPEHPHLAAALRSGEVSLELSKLILATLQKVEKVLSVPQLLDLEEQLVRTALTWGAGYETLAVYLKQVPNHVDPDGSKPREDKLRAQVNGWRKPLDNGLTRWQFDLDPERDAYLKAAVDACTAPRRGVLITGFDDEGPVDPAFDTATADTRTSGERVVDALLTVVRKGMAADDGRVGRSLVKVAVTMTKESLVTALGSATLAGIDEPISAATARRMAANAELIPQVLGGPSEVLDQGVGRRFFTEAQREAMATRDGGCLWPGCTAPPSWCEAAHRLPWFGDHPTNLDNGLLLCSYHHHRYDNDGWSMDWDRDGVPWFTPPLHVDVRQRPRAGGRPPLPLVA
jgi:5-methylcytosine-specific restriction protein A